MSLLTILLLKPDLFSEGWWYANERFAKNDKTAFGWLIIYKDIVSESRDKIRSEQLRLLAKDERVPNIAELVWFISTYYEVRNIKLFKRVAARTSSFFRSHCVEVGYDCWGYSGLIVDHSDVDSICSGIGISAAR